MGANSSPPFAGVQVRSVNSEDLASEFSLVEVLMYPVAHLAFPNFALTTAPGSGVPRRNNSLDLSPGVATETTS